MKTDRRSRPFPARPLRLFASLWSLRQYPSKAREWSWRKKFAAIRAAGLDGVFSPPIPALGDRGDLQYLAVTSVGVDTRMEEAFSLAQQLGAIAIDVQLGDFDTRLTQAVALAGKVRAAAQSHGLPFAIETHRDTFTETPEATLALAQGYEKAMGEELPLCLDHSHFSVVRHLPGADLWTRLREPGALLAAATQYHLRPFNGHHCQLPALTAGGRRTPEYRDWLHYVDGLFAYEHARPTTEPMLVVIELGHAAPGGYRLSGFPDTWRDVVAVAADLRRRWKNSS
jgi:hypothetical protein